MARATGDRRDTGPGILEMTLVFGLAGLLALVVLAFFGGPLGEIIDIVADIAHGGG